MSTRRTHECDTSIVGVATVDDVKRAWAQLIGVSELTKFLVIVQANSPLAPPGWIGLLTVDDTMTACVPTPEHQERLRIAAGDWGSRNGALDTILARFPTKIHVLGPAGLFYNLESVIFESSSGSESVPPQSIGALADSVSSEDLDESGITEVDGDVLVIRSNRGVPIAACGYRVWPNKVANICVLVHPDYRRLGNAYSLAKETIARAGREGLLVQWRARPDSSRGLARSLGLIEVGAQLSFELP
jgi:GNAT superfamily N-acetyltransferase